MNQAICGAWMSQACDALYKMRTSRADSMLDFAARDPAGFCQMVEAMQGLGAALTVDVVAAYKEVKNGRK